MQRPLELATPRCWTTHWGPSKTDIMYRYQNLSGTVLGRARCDDDSLPGFACDQHYVEYDNRLCEDHFDCDPVDWNAFRTLACHETGHTTGLTHGTNADPEVVDGNWELRCLRTPLVANDPNVGTHNASMVNATY